MRPIGGFMVAGLVGLAVVAAGCGNNSATGPTTSTVASASRSSGLPDGLRTESASIGKVLAVSSGRTVYELVGATASHSKCTGTCLSIWPPVKASGKQVVYKGHPLYEFSGDSAAGQTNGNGLKDSWGTWWAMSSNGSPLSSSGSSPSTTAASSGGGY